MVSTRGECDWWYFKDICFIACTVSVQLGRVLKMMGYNGVKYNTTEYGINETSWVAGNLTTDDQSIYSNITTIKLPGLNKGDIGFEAHSEAFTVTLKNFSSKMPSMKHFFYVVKLLQKATKICFIKI